MAGVQHQELGQLDEALLHFNLAVAKDSSCGAYWFNRGIVKSKKDMIQEAVDDYGKATSLLTEQDQQYQAYFNRGICLRRLGPDHLEESIKHLKKAVEMKNDRPSVLLNSANRSSFSDLLNVSPLYAAILSIEKKFPNIPISKPNA